LGRVASLNCLRGSLGSRLDVGVPLSSSNLQSTRATQSKDFSSRRFLPGRPFKANLRRELSE
jgi:hypothetical protein